MSPTSSAKQQHFLLEVEQLIKSANREIIDEKIPPISKYTIVPFAASVAELRATYLEAAFNFSEKAKSSTDKEADVKALRIHREMYEEARDAFEALRHAIERGYVDIAE